MNQKKETETLTTDKKILKIEPKVLIKTDEIAFKKHATFDEPETKPLYYRGFKYYYRYYPHQSPKLAPILFLGGAFQNIQSWKKYSDYFNQYTDVLLTELPGMGNADVLPGKYGVDFLTDSIENLLKNFQFKKINIMAVSYGTPIAYLYTKRYPFKVSHLALSGTMKSIPEEYKKTMRESISILKSKSIEEFIIFMTKTLSNTNPRNYIINQKFAQKILALSIRNMNTEAKKKYIENTYRLIHLSMKYDKKILGVPTLLFTGEFDPFTKPEYCKEIAEEFETVIFTTIKNADHLFPLEQFEYLIQLLSQFLFDEKTI